jgi:AcrR family transcriptional regulator
MTVRLSRAERRDQTRKDLLDAAARVFVERGFEGASIEAIAEEGGYTRGAFYSNFGSKAELFAELLQQRVYTAYRRMAEASVRGERATLRETGEHLAAIQGDKDGRWLFRLWLELLAHAGRDEQFRTLARGFWSTNRELTAEGIRRAYKDAGTAPPAAPEQLATAMIAMDIGLALQHFVDPDAVPLTDYPELYELLFEPLAPPGAEGSGP